MTIWGFGVGGTLSGLVRAGRVLGDDAYVQHVAELVGPALGAPTAPTDHLIAVEALLELRAARPSTPVDDACARWIDAILGAPRLTPGGPRVHRPDLERWSSTIWVDCMHTDGPGLAALGRPGDAVNYAEEYAAVLQRDDGLFHHGYDAETGRGNGVAWGRGQAWALLRLVDTLHAVPDDVLSARLHRLVHAMATHEDAGRWHTVVDDHTAPVENSVAAYVAYGVARAIRYGLVSAEHAAMADRAFDVTLGSLTGGGLVVSEATPVGDVSSYVERGTGVFPWGQAPVLHALLDRAELPDPHETLHARNTRGRQ